MSGTREDWAKILPLLTAFVKGAAIQHKDYRGRWEDASTMTSLMCGGASSYRLTPEHDREGTWSVNYTFSLPGRVDGPHSSGVMEWSGKESDEPPWGASPGVTYDLASQKFTPNNPQVDHQSV